MMLPEVMVISENERMSEAGLEFMRNCMDLRAAKKSNFGMYRMFNLVPFGPEDCGPVSSVDGFMALADSYEDQMERRPSFEDDVREGADLPNDMDFDEVYDQDHFNEDEYPDLVADDFYGENDQWDDEDINSMMDQEFRDEVESYGWDSDGFMEESPF